MPHRLPASRTLRCRSRLLHLIFQRTPKDGTAGTPTLVELYGCVIGFFWSALAPLLATRYHVKTTSSVLFLPRLFFRCMARTRLLFRGLESETGSVT
jgi:hypothetical protein